jgi:FMN phosphatase YigB (HAD superfamily)
MKNIQRYYFLAGGVILPRLSAQIIAVLEKQGNTLTERQRLALFDLERDMFSGALPAGSYFDRVNTVAAPQQPLALDGFLQGIEVDAGALSVADELRRRSQVVLLSDYPPDWLAAIDRRSGICAHFDRVLPLQGMGCEDDRAAIFSRLCTADELTAGTSLLVDANPFRTALAIRRGVDAVIYVDERRLRRELRLRSLIGKGK